MEQDDRDFIIESLKNNGIKVADNILRNPDDYKLVAFKDEFGRRKVRIAKIDEPLKEGEENWDIAYILESMREDADKNAEAEGYLTSTIN